MAQTITGGNQFQGTVNCSTIIEKYNEAITKGVKNVFIFFHDLWSLYDSDNNLIANLVSSSNLNILDNVYTVKSIQMNYIPDENHRITTNTTVGTYPGIDASNNLDSNATVTYFNLLGYDHFVTRGYIDLVSSNSYTINNQLIMNDLELTLSNDTKRIVYDNDNPYNNKIKVYMFG